MEERRSSGGCEGTLIPNNNQPFSTNEIQWIIVSKRDGKSKLLPRGMIFVGREECDIILSSTTVDKRHAVIFFNTSNEQFHVKDLNSSYGTYVNEKRIPDQFYLKLEHSDRLRFGFGPDVFIIEKISCLSLTSNASPNQQMINSVNTQTNTNSKHIKDSNEEEENQRINSVNKQINSESIVLQKEVHNYRSEEPTATHLSIIPTEHSSKTASAHITDTAVSQTDLPPTQTISALSEICENNSNSSLSTDSLDEIKPSKRVVNNLLSPVNESNEITSINTYDMRNNDVITPKNDNHLKSLGIVNKKGGLSASNSTTPASASCISTSGPAMAFIIPFDSDDKSSKKKMNIKDSIRQFAPPKPDSIEKPRSQKTNNNDLNKTDKTFGIQKSPTMQSKQKSNIRLMSVNNSSPVDNFNETNGHLSDSATYLIHRMLCSESQNTMPVKNIIESSNIRRNSSDLSLKSTPTKEKCSPSNSGEKDSGVSGDNKSETGTYTVELDQNDDELEDARKKIDEIFGVFDDSNTFSLQSSPESTSLGSDINSAHTLLLTRDKCESNSNLLLNNSFSSPKFSRKLIPNEQMCELSDNHKSIDNTSTFTRRKLQTPVNPLISNDSTFSNKSQVKANNTNLGLLYSYDLSNKNINNSDIKSNRNKNVFSENYNTSHKNNNYNNNTINSTCKPVHISHSAPTTPRSPLVLRKILQMQSKNNSKANNQRKNSWSHSNSDLDHYESYNSDESTDQSQRSSNSALSKDGGNISSASVPSKMRFNRAFALRRARLGIETPGIQVDLNKSKAKTNTKEQQQKSSFSRNDGGRFSLRLPKNDSIQNSTKNTNQSNSINRITSQERLNKSSLHRKASDPISNKIFNGNRSDLKSTLSDNDRSVNNRRNSPWIQSLRQNNYSNNNNNNNNNNSNNHNSSNSLQKSASFADSKVIDSNRNSDNSSVRTIPTFQVGKRFFSTKPHQMAQIESSLRPKNISNKSDIMSMSMNEPSNASPLQSPSSVGKSSPQHNSKNKSLRELSALDSLVVSAINQLSQKLKTNMRTLLEKERLNHELGTETRVLIDEILPQVSSPDRRLNDNYESNISRDLSNILKNLKKVEQSFDVVTMLLDPNAVTSLSSRRPSNGFFVVNV